MTDLASYLAQPVDFTGLRLGAKTVEALELMAYSAIPLKEAADQVGIRRSNLGRAFDMPAVRQRWNELVRQIRDNEGSAAYRRISELSRTAASEHVRLEANKWLAGVDGVAPVKRVEGKFAHAHSFGGFTYDEADDMRTIEGETLDP